MTTLYSKPLGKGQMLAQATAFALLASQEKGKTLPAEINGADCMYYHYLGITIGLLMASGLSRADAVNAANQKVVESTLPLSERSIPF